MSKQKISLIKHDSLKKRYFYKLFTNFFGLGVNAFIQAVVPRGLGPKLYGDYSFLINFFNQFINFLDMGTSTGFYTKISQRPKETKLVTFYFYFILIVAFIVMTFVVLAQITGLHNIFWPDQISRYIYLAVILGIFIWLINILVGMADAWGLTVAMETAKIFQKIFGLFIIVVLFLWHNLNLGTFFLYNYIISVVLIIAFYYIVKKHGFSLWQNLLLASSEIRKYVVEFYAYSHPFFLYSLVGMIAGIFDRWLLQISAGSVQQGFFGLSYQIGAICFMFTGAMTPLIMREFSIAYNNKDIKTMGSLFRKHVPFLYSITAFLACFIVINADKVTIMMGGGKFSGATLAVAIMAFYPVHQAYGQLSGSVFFASNRTKLYCNIGIIFMLLSLPVTYFLIAPKQMYGLGLGSTGLAGKMVLIQLFTINVQLYFNSRMLGLVFWKYLAHQLASLVVFLILAAISRLFAGIVLSSHFTALADFFLCGLIYLAMTLILIYFFPVLVGSKDREQLIAYIPRMKYKDI